jgi:hypothetical protein
VCGLFRLLEDVPDGQHDIMEAVEATIVFDVIVKTISDVNNKALDP